MLPAVSHSFLSLTLPSTDRVQIGGFEGTFTHFHIFETDAEDAARAVMHEIAAEVGGGGQATRPNRMHELWRRHGDADERDTVGGGTGRVHDDAVRSVRHAREVVEDPIPSGELLVRPHGEPEVLLGCRDRLRDQG